MILLSQWGLHRVSRSGSRLQRSQQESTQPCSWSWHPVDQNQAQQTVLRAPRAYPLILQQFRCADADDLCLSGGSDYPVLLSYRQACEALPRWFQGGGLDPRGVRDRGPQVGPQPDS